MRGYSERAEREFETIMHDASVLAFMAQAGLNFSEMNARELHGANRRYFVQSRIVDKTLNAKIALAMKSVSGIETARERFLGEFTNANVVAQVGCAQVIYFPENCEIQISLMPL